MKASVWKKVEAFVAENSRGPFLGRRWTRHEAKRARAMLDRGEPLDAICRELDCTPGDLRILRKRLGLEFRVRDPDGRLAGVARLAKDGRSDGEVADALGCSRSQVVACRQKLGIPAQRKRGGRQPKPTSPSPF